MTVPRVDFQEQQILTAGDLNAEQLYHLSAQRRHELGLHGWGILYGLELVRETGQVVLLPGRAVDGFGRELIVSKPFEMPFMRLRMFSQNFITLWLCYQVAEAAGNHCDKSRLVEEARKSFGKHETDPGPGLRPSDPQGKELLICARLNDPRWQAWKKDWARTNPHQPAELSQFARTFTPAGDPPDDPSQVWPVYVGKIDVGNDFTVEMSGRPYARLAGESIHSASRRVVPDDPKNPEPLPPAPFTQVQVGGADSGQTRRFAVRVADEAGQPVERLVVNQPGETVMRGDLTLNGDEAGCPTPSNLIFWEASQAYTPPAAAVPAFQQPAGLPAPKTVLEGNRLGRGILALPPDRPIKDILHGPLLISPEMLRRFKLSLPTIRRILANPIGAGLVEANYSILKDLYSACVDLSADEPITQPFALQFEPLPTSPKTAQPWRIYTTDIQREGKSVRQLRIEVAAPPEGSPPNLTEAAVGVEVDENSKPGFDPCLIVEGGCRVVVPGTLVVRGRVFEPPVGANPDNPLFVNELLNSIRKGKEAANTVFNSLNVALQNVSITNRYISYNLVLTNNGSAMLGPFTIADVHSVGGENPVTQSPLSIDQTLAPGLSLPLPVIAYPESHTVGQTVYISITVVAKTPQGLAAYGSARGQGTTLDAMIVELQALTATNNRIGYDLSITNQGGLPFNALLVEGVHQVENGGRTNLTQQFPASRINPGEAEVIHPGQDEPHINGEHINLTITVTATVEGGLTAVGTVEGTAFIPDIN